MIQHSLSATFREEVPHHCNCSLVVF